MKKFKHLFTALAIVFVAFSVSGCKDGLHSDQLFVSVELHLSNPSGKTIHCEYTLKAVFDRLNEGAWELLNNKDVISVSIMAVGEGTDFIYEKRFDHQASGSFDFELDDETDGVSVDLSAEFDKSTGYDLVNTTARIWINK